MVIGSKNSPVRTCRVTLVDGALSGTHVYTPESLDLKIER